MLLAFDCVTNRLHLHLFIQKNEARVGERTRYLQCFRREEKEIENTITNLLLACVFTVLFVICLALFIGHDSVVNQAFSRQTGCVHSGTW